MSARKFTVPLPHAAADISACTRKVKIASKQNAKMAAARASRAGDNVRCYECPTCGHWHPTSMPLDLARARRRS